MKKAVPTCHFNSLMDVLHFMEDECGCHDILISKNDKWYIWTGYDTVVPAEDENDREEYHDSDERKNGILLTDDFGTPYAMRKSWKTLWVWVK